ncbi:hypothetical protein GIB67_036312 [Kingdonia uniflora]|uniref:HEAT repeat-containing protein 5B n=2 Tax=Magnoliopsida TaxID=3398 RepID=A0A7J7L3S3_9MAGN|nr:hypothetical protein GIB67_036312 [Kingdonia uniflora]
MAKKYVRENVPLSRFGVLVAQLESIVASASQQSPDALLCFDLLSDLISAIDEEPKESILLWQRKCEDALYSLLILGARRPIRHLASLAMARIIYKGDAISIYSRASILQGLLSDGKRSEPLRAAGAAQCLGELYRHFGRRITSGLLETTNIAAKLMKFHEDFVRHEALEMLQNALEGSCGSGASAAYNESFRLIMRTGVGDKSFIVRIAAARCLKTFASIGGPGLGITDLENSSSYCVKALEDPVSSVRDTFAEALGALLALGMNPDAEVQTRTKNHSTPVRKLEGGLQKHLIYPFMKATGARSKDVRIGLTLSWIFFLQVIRLKYLYLDSELPNFALQAMDMLRGESYVDAHALACVLYILRVGITDQMTETTQRSFLVILGRQLESTDLSPSMVVAALRTLTYILKTLGEVPQEFREVLDNTIVAALSHSSVLVRIEAALTLRALAEVDPTCVGGLISYAVTTLSALRESISFGKGDNLTVELDSLHGQATILSALVSISPKLPLGYPARLPKTVLDVAKRMLTECSRNPVAALLEKESGWLLLASLISSMPKEELEDQVFDILSLWVSLFSGYEENQIKQVDDLTSEIRLRSAAVDALTSFIKSFITATDSVNNAILLQPVLVYLTRAMSYVSFLAAKQQPKIKPAMDLFIIKTLTAYQSLSDPITYKSDHPQIIKICTAPFRDPSGCEESSCLRFLLDKRDAWLGPWIPGRDWFEDELRAFQGGKDGLLPCIWENELSTFPQPETTSKMLVNQMLLCFGILFATQDSGGMLSLLSVIDQCLKAGKKQHWRSISITNACVALLAGLKALLALRPQPLGVEILSFSQAIFQGILAEGDICAAQRRASSEGLGLLARLGNDIFTARMTRSLLGDLVGATDSSYSGSIALSLGCIHRSAGGMALSTLVPATVNSISLLAKSTNAGLQIWSLHGLLLTIEAAGLSYVSQVQATLLLAMEILLSEDNGRVDLRQGIGRLINAIVAVLGPELAPGSIFFSRCKSVVAEISSGQETATLLESIRFTQQLILFAPQAVSMHSHVKTLLPTLSARQPILRHLAVSTLRHLIEKDPLAITADRASAQDLRKFRDILNLMTNTPHDLIILSRLVVAIIDEPIEENLFHMLDEETDSEIGNLVRATINRLLYVSCPSCPSHWISICRKIVLATAPTKNAGIEIRSKHDPTNGSDGKTESDYGEDVDNMVGSAQEMKVQGFATDIYGVNHKRDSHLRYRTRAFAAECLSHLPAAVGKNPAHFDLSLARKAIKEQSTGDWLVLHMQELIALAYQISTIQFESLQPTGVQLLCTIMDKFESIPDPELPGHFLMEQYQAQFVSAFRTALNTASGPLLLEVGLLLATKVLTSSVTRGDQAAVKRIFSLISRPLNDFKDLYYPSFAEWVACKIKIRLLAAHACVKSYTYSFLRRQDSEGPDEYLALIPEFSKNSSILGKYWLRVLQDYSYICYRLQPNTNYIPFLDGIQSPLVWSKLQGCLDETWPVILQAVTLDAVPHNFEIDEASKANNTGSARSMFIAGYEMVKLEPEDFQFLWGFAVLAFFQVQHLVHDTEIQLMTSSSATMLETSYLGARSYEIPLLVFHSLSTKRFFSLEFLTLDLCKELLQVFVYSVHIEESWESLAIPVLSQIVQFCPKEFLEAESFSFMALELCITYLYKIQSIDAVSQDNPSPKELLSTLFVTAEILLRRFKTQVQLTTLLAFMLTSYTCLQEASTKSCFSEIVAFVQSIGPLLMKQIKDKAELDNDGLVHTRNVMGAWQNAIISATQGCIKGLYLLENKRTNTYNLLKIKLAFFVEQAFCLAKLSYGSKTHKDDGGDFQILYPVCKNCIKCIQMILNDFDVQVQLIVLQVLKSMAQKEHGDLSNGANYSFVMFFTGEFLGDIFKIVEKMLKKPLTRDTVAITTECLTLLFLLQTLCKVSECQKNLMNLLLEAIVMVVSASTADPSQELVEIKGTALRLVSHLAQIPSSAVHFKDVLLAMPVTRRHQLQDICLVMRGAHRALKLLLDMERRPMVQILAMELQLFLDKLVNRQVVLPDMGIEDMVMVGAGSGYMRGSYGVSNAGYQNASLRSDPSQARGYGTADKRSSIWSTRFTSILLWIVIVSVKTITGAILDIIRASVSLDKDSTQMKPSSSPLLIKLPFQVENNRSDDLQVHGSTFSKDTFEEEEDDDNEEDEDWDAFQSFPADAEASASNSQVDGITTEPASVDSPSILSTNDNNFQHLFTSQPRNDIEDINASQPLNDVDDINDAQEDLSGGCENTLFQSHGDLPLQPDEHLNQLEEDQSSQDKYSEVSSNVRSYEDTERLNKDERNERSECNNNDVCPHPSSLEDDQIQLESGRNDSQLSTDPRDISDEAHHILEEHMGDGCRDNKENLVAMTEKEFDNGIVINSEPGEDQSGKVITD